MRASCSDVVIRALVLGLIAAAPLSAQRPEPPRVQVTPFGGISVRESGTGLRIGDDVLTYGLRAVLPGSGFHPWVEVSRFDRPDLECVQDLACNDAGWLLRFGAMAVVSPAPQRPGIHPRLVGGIGAAFSEETTFSHVLGIGVAWRLSSRLSPTFDVRWERLPRINILLVNVGLRIDVP